MKKEYNLVYSYKTYKFNICVELNVRTERRPDGNTWHNLIVNDMGNSNYYTKKEVDSLTLSTEIRNAYSEIHKFVDEKEGTYISPLEKMLIKDFGFK